MTASIQIQARYGASLHNAKAAAALQKPLIHGAHVSVASKIFYPSTFSANYDIACELHHLAPKTRPGNPAALKVNKQHTTNFNFASMQIDGPDNVIIIATPQRHRHLPVRRPPRLH